MSRSQNSPLIPIAARYMIFSSFSFALMAACVKALDMEGIPVIEIIFFRALVSLLISYAVVKKQNLSLWGNKRGLLLARGCVGTVALFLNYKAFTMLPLAEAFMIQYLNPIFTTLLAIWLLKERLHSSLVICAVLSLIGLFLIVQPYALFNNASTLSPLGVTVALIAAFLSAIAYTLVKKLSATESSSVIIFYFPLVALPFSLMLMSSSFVLPSSLNTWVLLILVGFFTQGGQIGLTKAMRYATASNTMAYSYVKVLFAVFIGWFYFGEYPELLTWLGGTSIFLGMLINLYGHKKTLK